MKAWILVFIGLASISANAEMMCSIRGDVTKKNVRNDDRIILNNIECRVFISGIEKIESDLYRKIGLFCNKQNEELEFGSMAIFYITPPRYMPVVSTTMNINQIKGRKPNLLVLICADITS